MLTQDRKYPGVVAGLVVVCALIASSAFGQTAAAVSCTPSIISGGSGDSASCTVTLSAAAPAGGTAVTLASSLMELAAVMPRVTVPAGQSRATFTVATNSRYRHYSGLGFSAAISASANGTTRTTTVSVTAAPAPASFTSGSQGGARTQWSGLMCGGIAPIGGEHGILYNCSAAQGTGFGTCTFHQECALGCRRVPPNGSTFNDFCATAGPNAVSISRNTIVSGDRLPASIVAEAPAGQAANREQGVPATRDINFNSSYFPHAGGIGFPDGATSVPFDVATSYTPGIEFVDVVGFWFNASIPPFLITNGRAGHAWLVMLPPDPPPSIATPTLGDFLVTGSNPIVGGNSTIGQIDLSGLSRAGGPTFTVTSDNPAIVPAQTFSAPANENLLGFQALIQTKATSSDANVTLTATDGRYRFSRALTVRAAPPPPVLADVTVDPTSVIGGNSATGTVVLSAPQAGATTVALSTPAPASVATMPSSITIPAGATTANFTVRTFAVSSQFNMNIFADLPGNPGRQALLLIQPGGSTAPPPPPPPPPPAQTATLTVSASGRSGERIISSPTGINVAVGSSGSAAFTSGTSITLSVSNGRDAVWSGACSSNGNKTRTCRFTISGNASVSANVK